MARRRKQPRIPSPAPSPASDPIAESRERSWPALVSLPLLVSFLAVAFSMLVPDVPLSIPALAGLMISVSVVWSVLSWLRRIVRARSSTRYGR